MANLKEYIRYHSGPRKMLYKLLKFCDKIPPYKAIYSNRIAKEAAIVSDFPNELSIETINLCNAKCTICAHPDMKRAKGKMETDLAKSLIDQAAMAKVGKLFLSGFGEPLLDKRLPEFIARARHQGIENLSIVTNGYLLTPETAFTIIDAGITEIIISMDGFTAETYENIRLGLKFDKVADNIKQLPGLKNRALANISISCVDLIHNHNERKQAYDLFGRCVDGIYFRQAQGWTGRFGRQEAGYSPHFEPNTIPCRYLWDSASVYIDGKVPACCLDYEAEGVLGDASRDSLSDIWRGERFKYYRQGHLANHKDKLSPCAKCGYYSVWW
ncbi:MAG: radical SAM protein [candidate division Zixibacteria bacterium]|nr:radical SAM protein [candidate division Zixibacteria bacterium]